MKQDRSRRFPLLPNSTDRSRPRHLARLIKLGFAGAALLLSAHMLASKPAQHVRKSMVSDWAQRYVRYPDSNDESVMAIYRRDPRWEQGWYARHREAWWPEFRREREHEHQPQADGITRDWSINLGASPSSTVINFSFVINTTETAYGSVSVTDQGGGKWLATSGSLTITGGADLGTWALIPITAGTATTPAGTYISPLGRFQYDNAITPANNPALDQYALLFGTTGAGAKEINVWGNSANNYSFYDATSAGYGQTITATGSFSFQPAPGGGQSTPAKYTFDVNATPSCANDFVATGIAATPAAGTGGQANIVGVNNLYRPRAGGNCTTGPTVIFAYASGTGQIPASVAISLNGTQLAYVENLSSGKSYFHVLTIGTGAGNGTIATPMVPGTGNNAVDNTVLLSPDGGITNESSTSAPFISYTDNDVADTAYVTTYTNAGGGSGYLYKIGNVFTGSAPTILWKVAINAIPGPPVYQTGSNSVFFTDSNGRIDYVYDSGTSPTVTYGGIVAGGTTSLNPVTCDIAHNFVYATFNTNGTNALVVQAATTLASSVSVPVGTGNTTYSGPYGVDFNNEWYTGTGTAPPLLFVVGTGASGTTPTLYSVGFGSGGLLNGTVANSGALASAAGADASPPTEFYNPNIGGGTDFLFVSVTNHCIATTGGGTAGCVMSLTLPKVSGTGFPAIGTGTTAAAASGGTTEIVIDNDNTALSQASSIYYGTKTGGTLVKSTQSALN